MTKIDLKILEEVTLKLKKVIDEIFEKESFYNAIRIKKEDIELDYDLVINNSFLESNDWRWFNYSRWN